MDSPLKISNARRGEQHSSAPRPQGRWRRGRALGSLPPQTLKMQPTRRMTSALAAQLLHSYRQKHTQKGSGRKDAAENQLVRWSRLSERHGGLPGGGGQIPNRALPSLEVTEEMSHHNLWLANQQGFSLGDLEGNRRLRLHS